MGDLSLDEMAYRVTIADDLGMTLEELGERVTGPELDDWMILYGVEAEAEQQAQANAERRT